jgi:hypothetical protein
MKKMSDKEWLEKEQILSKKTLNTKLNAKGKASVAPVKPMAKVIGKGKK